MKRMVAVFIVMMIYSFVLVGCDSNPTTEVTVEQKFFTATVLEVNTESLLVEPDEGTTERKSSDKIQIEIANIGEEQSVLYLNSATVGDKIQIGYLDGIKESYPAQINEVFEVLLIESK